MDKTNAIQKLSHHIKFRKASYYKWKQQKWSDEEDIKLITLVNTYNHCKIKWNEISAYFNKSTHQCYSRYTQINPNFSRGKWSKEEDDLLISLVKQFGKKWAKISKIMKNRSGKQIRDRFINCLDESNLKEPFSEEEDKKIIKFYKLYGSKWSVISKKFIGRTGDAIKNRFNWYIKPGKKFCNFI